MNYIFVFDYWIPFPSSEYGGIVIISAVSEEEAELIAKDHTSKFDKRDYDTDQLVKNTDRKVIGTTDRESGVIDMFVT